jgi:hypothetical protein
LEFDCICVEWINIPHPKDKGREILKYHDVKESEVKIRFFYDKPIKIYALVGHICPVKNLRTLDDKSEF